MVCLHFTDVYTLSQIGNAAIYGNGDRTPQEGGIVRAPSAFKCEPKMLSLLLLCIKYTLWGVCRADNGMVLVCVRHDVTHSICLDGV